MMHLRHMHHQIGEEAHSTTALGNQPAASLGMLPLPVEEFEALGVQKGEELGVGFGLSVYPWGISLSLFDL